MHGAHIVNLKRLEHLISVSEEGSLAGAARRVHLTQPALTRSIQALEDEAGMALFDRGPRGVTLTAAGRMMKERAQRILFETRCLARDLSLMQKHEIGSVQLGMGPYAAAMLLPEVLSALHRDWPKLKLRAEVNSPPALFAALEAEDLDFLVVEAGTIPAGAELEVHKLAPEPAGCFARPRHPLCARTATLAQLRETALVSVVFGGSGDNRWRKLLRCKPGDPLPIQVQSNDLHALVHLVRHSNAVLFAPVRAVRHELAVGTLKQISVDDMPGGTLQYCIVHLTQRTLSPAAARAAAAIEASSRLSGQPA